MFQLLFLARYMRNMQDFPRENSVILLNHYQQNETCYTIVPFWPLFQIPYIVFFSPVFRKKPFI